jgi:hypothetical protein
MKIKDTKKSFLQFRQGCLGHGETNVIALHLHHHNVRIRRRS